MSYITKEKDSMYKDERNLVTLNKDLFAFASDFTDVYFANDLNWGKIAIHFKHSTSNQKKIIVLREESNAGFFEVSEMARTGTWQIEQIQVFDKDGDMMPVKRADMPTPTNFDIVTERKIAPSELIASFSDATHIVMTAGKAVNYEVGFKVKLWDDVALDFLSSQIFTVVSVAGDVIEVSPAASGYAGKTLRLKFPNFADASPRQKGIYQFIGSTF